MFEKLLKHNSALSKKKNIGRNPDIDWIIVLTILVVLFVILVANSVFTFMGVVESQDQVKLTEINRPNLNTEGIEKVLVEYRNRKLQFEERMKTIEKFNDPSI